MKMTPRKSPLNHFGVEVKRRMPCLLHGKKIKKRRTERVFRQNAQTQIKSPKNCPNPFDEKLQNPMKKEQKTII